MTIVQAVCARPFGALTLIALSSSLAAVPASAHVTLANAEASPNSHYKGVLQVPHGCDGEATTSVRVQIPEGVIAVKPMPKAGWTLTTTRGAYAKTYENHGRKVSEGVKEIVWSGGNLADEHFDEFTFAAVIATEGGAVGAVYFPTVQSCAKGEVAWTQIPTAQQSARDMKTPAPILRISAKVAQAGGHHHHHHAATAGTDTFKVGDITVEAPWTRATPGGAKVAGGYMKVTNNGSATEKLIGGTTDIAGRIEIHEMAVAGGVMQMRPLNAGLEIKAGESVELKPGGLHVMFMNLKRQLKQDDSVKVTLQFEKAGKVEVTFRVNAVGASGGGAKHHHH
jgi:uncharacterized protein YcnI/copper(I)-binding protein